MCISAIAQKIVQQRKSVLISAVNNVMCYFIVAILLFSGLSKIIDQVQTIETRKVAFKLHDELRQFKAIAILMHEMFIKPKWKYSSITLLEVVQIDFC